MFLRQERAAFRARTCSPGVEPPRKEAITHRDLEKLSTALNMPEEQSIVSDGRGRDDSRGIGAVGIWGMLTTWRSWVMGMESSPDVSRPLRRMR